MSQPDKGAANGLRYGATCFSIINAKSKLESPRKEFETFFKTSQFLKSKGKVISVWPRGWVEVQLYSSMTEALEEDEWSVARPDRTVPPGKTRYPFYRRLVGPQGRSGLAENLVNTGIGSRTVQPVAQSLYRLSYPANV